MDFFIKRCHKPVSTCSTVFSYNMRYTDWEKMCIKGVLLKKTFASFVTQKVWRFGGFPHKQYLSLDDVKFVNLIKKFCYVEKEIFS